MARKKKISIMSDEKTIVATKEVENFTDPVVFTPEDRGEDKNEPGYIVTGIVPTPEYDPRHPFFAHHASTDPTRQSVRSRENGSGGHVITVRCSTKATAQAMLRVFKAIFRDVKSQRADDI